MEFKFTVHQSLLGFSQCERLCARGSREVEDLATRSGWCGVPGEPLCVPVGIALNMLVLSIAKNQDVEPQAMAALLPGLRDEALLELGTEIPNWSFDGSSEAEQRFWPILYGDRDAVRSRIAPLLRCHSHLPTSQIRFFSANDIERLSSSGTGSVGSNRTPRFTISAQALAAQVRTTLGSPVFTAKAT